MVWTIDYLPTALKSLKKLDKPIQKRIKKELAERLAICHDPRTHPKVRKVKGADTVFRYRVGVYRVLFEVQEYNIVISVTHTGHRSEVYKGLNNLLKKAENRGFGFSDD